MPVLAPSVSDVEAVGTDCIGGAALACVADSAVAWLFRGESAELQSGACARTPSTSGSQGTGVVLADQPDGDRYRLGHLGNCESITI